MALHGKIDRVLESNDTYATVVFHDHASRRKVVVRGVWPENMNELRKLNGGLRVEVRDVGDKYRGKSLVRLDEVDLEAMAVAKLLINLGEGKEGVKAGAQVSKAFYALYTGLPSGSGACQALGGLSAQTIADRVTIKDVVSADTAQIIAAAVKKVYTPMYAAFVRKYPKLTSAQCFRVWEHCEGLSGGAERYIEQSPFRAAEVALGSSKRKTFADVDALAVAALGVLRNSPERIRRHGVEVVRQMAERGGHTHVSQVLAINSVGKSLGATRGDVLDSYAKAMLKDAWAHSAAPVWAQHNLMELGTDWGVVVEKDDFVYPAPHLSAEKSLVKMVRRLRFESKVATLKPVLPMDDYHPLQRQAVCTALSEPISILTGSPGTGKTRVLVRIIIELIKAGHRVVACSFTGKASQRLCAVLHSSPDYIPESHDEFIHFGKPATIHKVVQSPPLSVGPPLAVVLDEASMVALQVAGTLNAKCWFAERWVVCGDPFQLPSIKPGRVLHDMIDSCQIPTTTLTEVYRTKGSGALICDNALRVRDWIAVDEEQGEVRGGYAARGDQLATNPGEFEITNRIMTLASRAEAAVAWYELHGNQFLDAQVLCHMRKTCREINVAVRDAVNPAGAGKRQMSNGQNDIWREGDRVICTQNQYFDNVMEVANGEMGTIVSIENHADAIPAVGGESHYTVQVRLDTDEGGRLELFTQTRFNHVFEWSYAITVHKAQGSEWKHVMLHLDASTGQSLCNAHIAYTGFTRAQRSVTIEGTVHTLNHALSQTGEVYWRRSDFAARLAADAPP